MDLEHIFPRGSYSEEDQGDAHIYRVTFPDGDGRMEAYSILPGIFLIFNDFHTHHGFQQEEPRPGLIEINHCLKGRYDCTLPNGRSISIGPRDFAAIDMGHPPDRSAFTLGEYYGLSLVVEPDEASASLNRMLGIQALCLRETFHQLLDGGNVMVLRGEPQIQHIVSQMYDAPASIRPACCRLKAAELLLFLAARGEEPLPAPTPYFQRNIAWKLQEVEQRMTEDLRVRYPLEELARQNHISVATLKKQFRQVYGEPPYTYLKRRRMEEAALLLQTTKLSIREIAEAVGYQNPSKFSAAFAQRYGMPPTEYKKGILPD